MRSEEGGAPAAPELPEGGAPERPPEPPRRLHRSAIAVAAVGAFPQAVLPLAALGAITVLGDGVSASSLARLGVYGAIALVAAAVVGYVRWATTVYSLDEDAVSIRRGLLNRKQSAVPVERISSIDTVQNPVHRLFGVIELQVQAAGGGQEPEIRLEALSAQAADEVRAHARTPGAAQEARPERPVPPPLRRLSRSRLLAAALTSGQVTVILPVLVALSQSLDDLVGTDDGALGGQLVPDSVEAALIGLAILLLAAWLLAIAGTIVAFAGFTVSREDDRLQISRGLVQRRVSTIPLARIQAIRVVDGLLRQPFGLASLRVESAGYAREQSHNTTLFPLLPRAEVEAFVRASVPELAAPLGPLERPPGRAVWLYVGVPALAATGVALPLAVLVSPLVLVAVPFVAGAGALRLRAAGWRIDERFVVARARRLARSTVVAPRGSLPERTFAQGPLARRLDLATFAFALASRSRWAVAHIDAGAVRRLVRDLRPARPRT